VSPYRPDESSAGIWFWIALIAIINATWISMDLWLRAHNHEYLTTEFKEGLRKPLWGPLIVGLLAFTVAAFLWHMFNTRDGVSSG
jgi:hypothetical protein